GGPLIPGTNRPTKDAELILVCEPRKKSSAASISNAPADSGRVAIAISLFGVRLLYMGSASAGVASIAPMPRAITHENLRRISPPSVAMTSRPERTWYQHTISLEEHPALPRATEFCVDEPSPCRPLGEFSATTCPNV